MSVLTANTELDVEAKISLLLIKDKDSIGTKFWGKAIKSKDSELRTLSLWFIIQLCNASEEIAWLIVTNTDCLTFMAQLFEEKKNMTSDFMLDILFLAQAITPICSKLSFD